jgi:hypothetical protein
MAFTPGTTTVQLINIDSILISYRSGGVSYAHNLTGDQLEQGLSITHSIDQTVVVGNGNTVPKNEKVVITFNTIGLMFDQNVMYNIFKAGGTSEGINFIKITLDTGNDITLTAPILQMQRQIKTNDITRLVCTIEKNASDIDEYLTYSA